VLRDIIIDYWATLNYVFVFQILYAFVISDHFFILYQSQNLNIAKAPNVIKYVFW